MRCGVFGLVLSLLAAAGALAAASPAAAQVSDQCMVYQQALTAADQKLASDPDMAAAKARQAAAGEAWQALMAAPSASPAAQAQAHNDVLAARAAAEKIHAAKLAALFGAQGAELNAMCFPPLLKAYGGWIIDISLAPWQAELQWTSPPEPPAVNHACGAALIRADWIVTAAHCVTKEGSAELLPLTELRVRAGAARLGDDMQTFAIDEVFIPDGSWRFADGPRRYAPPTVTATAQNDIALVHFKPAARLGWKAPRPIALAGPGDVPGAAGPPLSVTGWGAVEDETFVQELVKVENGERLIMSPYLVMALLNPIANHDCSQEISQRVRSAYPGAPYEELPATVLCAGAPAAGTCTGDSGGPLVAHTVAIPADATTAPPGDRPVLVGLVSWGAGCQGFTVFARVAEFRDWIDATIAAHQPWWRHLFEP